jgi:hypothetical protein
MEVSMQANTEGRADRRPENSAQKNCRSDPFTVADGRYIAHDGFVVPRDCDEFLQRFPTYVRNWVARRLHQSGVQRDVEDWTQDLIVHLRCLPERSKHRAEGKQDVIQTFDPRKVHGANEARFRSYINLCLANRFNTLWVQRMKNPVCRTGNLSLSGGVDWDRQDAVDDEFCHRGSAYLDAAAVRSRKQHDDRLLVVEFIRFARRHDPGVMAAIDAIAQTGS